MESIWQKDIQPPQFPEFEGERHTDVLIIGGGITGILTAYFLKEKNIDCLVLEKNQIGSGTTSGTTAKLTFHHRLIYSELLKKRGSEYAKGYLEANKTALKKFEEMCGKIECDYEYRDNYIYSLNDRQKLEQEILALDKIGCYAQYCENPELPFNTQGAVKVTNQAQFNPLKFIYKTAENLNIYENSFARELKKNTAVTGNGTVTAKYIVVATHFPFLNKHGSYFLKLYQNRSYVLAMGNAPDLNGMYLDESETGMSLRNYKDYLLIGGGSHRTGKSGGGWDELRRFSELYYPRTKECCFWAAQDCMSLDGIPYIGNYSKRTPYLLTASGFNKWGMTGSMVSAMILSDIISGKKNQFYEIFNPSRNMIKPQLFLNGFEAVKNLLTVSKKRCPHMGCALKWNSMEHSWDCACHGSRFDKSGCVLDNPANGNLPDKGK